MKRQWIITLGILALVLAPVGWAMAADPCPDTGGTEFIVDTAADAEKVDDGYSNPACKLIIKTNIDTDAGVRNMRWEAKSTKVEGPVKTSYYHFECRNWDLASGRFKDVACANWSSRQRM
jgi:hypothetical protein